MFRAWGYNEYGQLGDGTTTNRLTPVQVQGLHDVVAIAAQLAQSTAITHDGSIWAWGLNNYGQLGDGTTIDHLTPIQVHDPANTNVLQHAVGLAAGGFHTLAIQTTSTNINRRSVTPGTASSLVFPNGVGQLNLPADLVSTPTTFTYIALSAPVREVQDFQFANRAFILVATGAQGNAVDTFPTNYTLTLTYQDSDLQAAGISEGHSVCAVASGIPRGRGAGTIANRRGAIHRARPGPAACVPPPPIPLRVLRVLCGSHPPPRASSRRSSVYRIEWHPAQRRSRRPSAQAQRLPAPNPSVGADVSIRPPTPHPARSQLAPRCQRRGGQHMPPAPALPPNN